MPIIAPKLLANISQTEKNLSGTKAWIVSRANPSGIIRNAAVRAFLTLVNPKNGRTESQR
jgi:hypothetical protein